VTVETAPPSAELDMVGERYRLLQRLVAPSEAAPGVWRGQDTVLNRPVTVTVHAPAGPAARALLEHAHALSMVEHPALPRVFDAEDEGARTWVVTEWVEGNTLAGLLADGTFDAQAAAAAIAKLAEGVAVAHRVGLSVGLLDPEHVVVTSRGTVTVTRLLVGRGSPDEDVQHLGALLYVALTGVWPLTEVARGRRGTAENGGLPTPRQARAGVPAELSAITMRALSPSQPDGLFSAAALAESLNHWHRQAEPEPFAADLAANERYPEVRRRRAAPALAFVAGFCAIGLTGLLVSSLANRNPGNATPPTTSVTQSTTGQSATPVAAPLPVVGVSLYDPPPGDGQENPNQVGNAADGRVDTVWATLLYRRNALFGNLKPGVGLIFDLGRQATVGSVRIQTTKPGAELQVRVGTGTTGPIESFPVVGQATGANQIGTDTTITLRPGITSRYYLVWFTKLVPIGNQFGGDLAEVQFLR
jgi:eukaryotic-like serine/threonine-protein kinase